ncbi:MAG: OmpA family protein [Rubrivivax sp.]|nr:OmpA family protein [Rubrivivax sp.]
MTLLRKMTTRPLALSLVALAALAGCSTVPDANPRLVEARSAYSMAQATPQTRDGAPVELKQAGDALARANEAFARRDDATTVDHLSYLTRQRVALAQEVGSRKAAEAAVARAAADRDQLRLAARTREADAALRSAQASQLDARAAQIQAQSAERDARVSQRQAEASQRQSAASQQQAGAAQQAASDAQQRALVLEGQLRDLDAKKTERGMVITIGDVLFDTGRAEIKSGGLRSMDKLVSFLKEYPQRKAMVEGFTDSVGSDQFNQELSARRADAVRTALVSRGVDSARIGTQGYGESFPVAGNDSAGGRQMNRRVEIVLSDDGGVVTPR